MDNKNKFQEMLGDVLEVARVQGNRLEMNEIKSLFGDMNLSEDQFEHIFAYLAANHIKIKGYIETTSEYTKTAGQEAGETEVINNGQAAPDKDREALPEPLPPIQEEKDSVYLKMYMKDLKAMKEAAPEEELILLDKILKGDNFAKNRYIEANLHYVVKIAEDYKNQGVSMEDLIQEGNIGLISSLESVSELTDREQGKEFITGYIRRYMEEAIVNQKESSIFENKIVKKISYIRDAADELSEDLGREANIHELARYIKMSEKEISDIFGMTADTIKSSSRHNNKEGHASFCRDNSGHNHDSGDH